ncbi:hypothetical protein FN976_15820 [Caenimonas sedimenti]|uniref:VanZ family protein n=1 Tax=Caenimonas sedimenti TaxID=2596921 RepID=A0A562ZQJ5_9BURK|nr:VanZ family protein [Caenimonas sedimenti]TWO70444.1 hypothetical protein FN976_15820 [Caenimonas sedimenti]
MNAPAAGHPRATEWGRWAWPAAGAYFLATSLGHLEFSIWLVRNRTASWGTWSFRHAVPALVVLGTVLLVTWLMRRAARNPGTMRTALPYWATWLACVALTDRFLTYSMNEYAHYPQYALLALLLARALDPDGSRGAGARVLFWTTALGMVDELMQYLWIAAGYGHYLDFNDFLVNLLAGAAGVMLYYGVPRAKGAPMAKLTRVEWFTAAILAAVLMLGFAAGWVVLSPAPGTVVPAGGWLNGQFHLQRAPDWYLSWQWGPHRGSYLVLPPAAGTALLFALFALFARYAPGARR